MWLAPYIYRVPVTVPAQAENLNNFIVPVRATLDHDTDGDVQFADGDANLLPQEIILNELNKVWAFVKVNLTTSTNVFYLYYKL